MYIAYSADFNASRPMLEHAKLIYWSSQLRQSEVGPQSAGESAVLFAVIVFDPWQNLYFYGMVAISQNLAGGAYLYYS